ncbi:MAG: DUF981 family protein [Thermoplasmata archaeon]|jgi:putative membrane protein
MAFIDILALEEVTLLIAAVVIGYVGLIGFLAMRRNDPPGLHSALRGAAIPIGSLGVIVTTLAIWGEFAWPLPGSYNILFTDVYLLFGLTLVILAISMAGALKLQYAGLFALVAGGVSIAYGWAGYGLNMTKEPLETFLLYGAFGLSGILAFPATLVVDHYFAHPDGTAFAFGSGVSASHRHVSMRAATRAAQPLVPVGSAATADPEPTPSLRASFHLPIYIDVTLLIFVASIALAGIAALFYLDSTLSAHLTSAP